MRRTLIGLSLAILVVAAFIVPMPVVAIAPGPALDVPPRVHLPVPTDPVNGRLLLTTVRIGEPPLAGVVKAWVDDDVDLLPRQAVIPPGVDERRYLLEQQQVFRESAQVAAAVGLRAAGHPVEITGAGAQVATVIPGSPADGVLREGDVIVGIDGRPVQLASDLVEATSRRHEGDVVTLEVLRGTEPRTVTVRLRKIDELGRPGLGVSLRTLNLVIRLAFPVEIEQEDIGGPSAGLMLALSVYDLTDPVDLARGRTVAGTGTIDLEGRVGAVGGVRQKVEAARQKGATVFLVPADEVRDARAGAGRAVTVVPVTTFDEAVAALTAR